MKAIITLTTIPSRLNSIYGRDIKYCLDSLVNQHNTDYEVHFNIPTVYKKTGEEYIIPEWLGVYEKDENFKVFRTEDYGSATKLIPTIKRVTDNDTIIIVVDDDVIYHPELVNEHFKNREKWPEYAVSYDGMRSRNIDGTFSSYFSDSRDYYYSATKINSLVDIVQHYSSVSYFRRFFENDFFTFWDENKVWCDDSVISAYLAMKKRGRLITYYEGDNYVMHDDHWKLDSRFHFPILEDTEHDANEGCNIDRSKNNEEDNIIISSLYRYLDYSYNDKTWEV